MGSIQSQHGYRGVGGDVDERRAQVVIAVGGMTLMVVRFFKRHRVRLGFRTCTQRQAGVELVRLRNDFLRLEIGSAPDERKRLPPTIGPTRLDRGRQRASGACAQARDSQPEPRRPHRFGNFKRCASEPARQVFTLVLAWRACVMSVAMPVTMPVAVMIIASA
jgi:hypothetical protein